MISRNIFAISVPEVLVNGACFFDFSNYSLQNFTKLQKTFCSVRDFLFGKDDRRFSRNFFRECFKNCLVFLSLMFTNKASRLSPQEFRFIWKFVENFFYLLFLFCFTFRSEVVTPHKRRQKWRFLAKRENLNCFNLFITQDYSGKHLWVDLTFKEHSFELCLVTQIDLDWKISTNQIHYKSY